MKKIVLWFLVLALLACCFTAMAEPFDIVSITSASSDRVYMRSQASADADATGLYYSGTRAVLLEEGEAWSYVMIGTEKGYVYNPLLSTEEVESKARLGTVISNGSLNLRAYPSSDASILARIPEGQSVLLLGEPYDDWYFVQSEQGYGYVMNDYIQSEGYAPQAEETATIPEALQGEWTFASGAGAWQVALTVFPDGTFWGYYHDADMGDSGVNYPKGTLYECHFTGVFSQLNQVTDYEYQMTVEKYHFFGLHGAERIVDDVRTRTISSAGVSEGNQLSLYLPGFPQEQMPENAQFQLRAHLSYTDESPSLLYNHTTEAGFIPD
ncbi:MAG: SH3 domain-containing protein [Clostridia bacterium]|nr:SH3 domain-containing protein [Clostridia bacterium]